MNLNLTGNHVEVTPAMREYVVSKISKITRHFDHVIDVSVILSVEKHKQKAEANVHVRGKDIFVEADGDFDEGIFPIVFKSSCIIFCSNKDCK